MNLAEGIVLASKPKGPKCTVTTMLQGLSKEDRAVMVEALGNPGVLASQLARGIELAGLGRVTAQTINRHRAGDCRCPR